MLQNSLGRAWDLLDNRNTAIDNKTPTFITGLDSCLPALLHR